MTRRELRRLGERIEGRTKELVWLRKELVWLRKMMRTLHGSMEILEGRIVEADRYKAAARRAGRS